MRIAVLGAGAMGSWFGGQLALAGHDVHLLTTNELHIAAIEKDGLQLRCGDAVSVVKPHAGKPDDFAASVELVLALTKTFQLDSAISSIAASLDRETAVLSLQNGLGNAEVLANHVEPDNVLVGVTMLPVDKIAPGIVELKGQGTTWFGSAGNAATDKTRKKIEAIEAAFKSTGLDVQHDAEIQKRLWGKVAFNAGMNAVCALTHGSPGLIREYPAATQLVRSAATEAIAVASAEGVVVDPELVFDTIDFACREHGDHKPSMLQDLLQGRCTEVGALNGAIVARGKACGIETPVNAILENLITLAERGHGC